MVMLLLVIMMAMPWLYWQQLGAVLAAYDPCASRALQIAL
jgi:hypothetical protein